MSLALISGAYQISDDDETGGEIDENDSEIIDCGNNVNGRIGVEDTLDKRTGEDLSTSPSGKCFSSTNAPVQYKEIVNEPSHAPSGKVAEKSVRSRPPGKRGRNHSKTTAARRYPTRRKTTKVESRLIKLTGADNSHELTTFNNFKSVTTTKLTPNGELLPQADAEFPCPHCPDAFAEAEGLIKHLPAHDEDAQGTLNNKIIRKPERLEMADDVVANGMENMDVAEPSYLCPFCPEAFGEAGGLIAHLPKHDGKSCSRKKLQSRINHSRSKRPKARKPTTKKIDRNNIPAVHATSFFDGKMNTIPPLKFPEIKLTRCDAIAGAKINRNKQGVHNSNQRKMAEKELNGNTSGSISMTKIGYKNGKAFWKCSSCNKIISGQSSAIVHIRVHTGSKPYQCAHCRKRFAHSGNLKQHSWTHTNRQKSWKCTNCQKRFPTGSALRQHMLVHTEVKGHACSFCSKRFRYLGNLKVHVRLHTGDTPHTCSLCPKRCATSSALKLHWEVHATGNPKICGHCQIAFRSSSSLKGHITLKHRK